ncbi:MAG: phosphatidate cytidylyltransferase [Bacteroides sp.]|nr:phosphatidate cytidylyltransferase [Bacteroides sp.]
MDINKLLLRATTGLIYVVLIVGCIILGQIPLTLLASLFAILAVIEFEKITHELSPRTLPALILDIAGCVTLTFSWIIWPLYIWVMILLSRMTLELYMKSSTPIANLAKSMMTQLYIGLPLALMCCLGNWFNLNVVLVVFIMIWINDTGAFLSGSMLGRHKLFERISPKKSWEGFIGGLVFNLIAATLFCTYGSSFFGIGDSLPIWLGLGAVVTIFATWGDLVESLLKRSLKIKDSGNIMPGHGGILDRIDSLLFVMPATLLYLTLFLIFL